MEKIVILGGGFAGVASGLSLLKNLPKNYSVALIDRNSFHLFTPSLYEVATREEPQKNIAIAYTEIFGNKIEVIKGEIEKIDTKMKKAVLKDGRKIDFKYLILALGSEPAFYGIPGLSKFSYPLKTVYDALKIKDQIHKLCDQKAMGGEKINIIVGGGGFAGTELAAELLEYIRALSGEHKIERNLFDISIIQGSDKLLKELDEHVSNIAAERLRKLGADVILGANIKEVFKSSLTTDRKGKFVLDLLIWTGGVKANKILESSDFSLNESGQVFVNKFLQVRNFQNIFAVGDVAEFIDPVSKKTAPGVGQVAEEQGRVAGENIARLINGKNLNPYKLRHFGYLIPLKGRYAVFTSGVLTIKGFFGWIIQQIVVLRYFLGILSFPKAFKRWNRLEQDLRQE